MAINTAVMDFIREAKAKNVGDDAILIVLRQRGWSDRKIYDGLTTYYEEEIGTVAPSRGGRAENAREAFFYLLSFAMLGIWVVALVWLGDLLIDRAFPSPLDVSPYQRSGIAWQMASIIVAFPIYLWINYLLGREIAQRPETLDSGVRKWLTYIALVITAGTLVGDAVWFLTTFLTGDLSQRFLAKAFMLFVVVGGVYWYYMVTIRSDRPARNYHRTFGSLAAAAVVAAIALGFAGIGSPSHGQELNYDNQRTQDLFALASSVTQTYASSKRLPKTLKEIDPAGAHSRDPQGISYRYLPSAAPYYSLCASFNTDTRPAARDPWRHNSGQWCYHFNAAQTPEYPGNS